MQKQEAAIIAARRPSPHGVRVLVRARSPYIPAWWVLGAPTRTNLGRVSALPAAALPTHPGQTG